MNNLEGDFKVLLRYDPDWRNVDIWFIKENPDGSRDIIEPFNMASRHEETHDMTARPEPTIRVDGRFAESFLSSLANGLAVAGFKPDELKVKDSEVLAIKAHLADMRQLVFSALLPPQISIETQTRLR